MKSMSELRDILCEQIDALRSEKTTPAKVNAVVNATGKILTSVKLEIEYYRFLGKQPKVDFIKLIGITAEEPVAEQPKAAPVA